MRFARAVDQSKDEDAPAATEFRFLTARREFTNAFGDLAQGKRNWQLVAFALLAILGVVTMSFVRLASTSRVVPYVIEVDKLGQVAAIAQANELKAPDARLIAAQLAEFIRNARTVLPTQASRAQAEMLRHAYGFVDQGAAGFLNEYFSNPKNDPRVLGGQLSREVLVTSVLRVPKSETWKLRWSETESSLVAGVLTRTTAWEGYVTVRLSPPKTVETVQQNPLGVYVTSVNWTQIAESTASARGQTDNASASSNGSSNGGTP
ncbi:MAG: VirB8/TrbF family protein [bacterium]